MKLLFIGNSYTFFNNLPELVRSLGAAAGIDIETRRFLRGGASLKTHVLDEYGIAYGRDVPLAMGLLHERAGTLRALLSEGGYDAAIMQGQSMDTVLTPDDYFAYGKVLADLLRAHGVPRIVLYETWARKHFPEMQRVITHQCRRLATAAGADVAPVGTAWSRVRTELPELVLHTADNSHPNAAGSYLAACVFLRTLAGCALAGLPCEFPHIQRTDDEFSGTPFAITPDVAESLQRIAETVC